MEKQNLQPHEYFCPVTKEQCREDCAWFCTENKLCSIFEFAESSSRTQDIFVKVLANLGKNASDRIGQLIMTLGGFNVNG